MQMHTYTFLLRCNPGASCRCLWGNAHFPLRKYRVAAIGGVLPSERYNETLAVLCAADVARLVVALTLRGLWPPRPDLQPASRTRAGRVPRRPLAFSHRRQSRMGRPEFRRFAMASAPLR